MGLHICGAYIPSTPHQLSTHPSLRLVSSYPSPAQLVLCSSSMPANQKQLEESGCLATATSSGSTIPITGSLQFLHLSAKAFSVWGRKRRRVKSRHTLHKQLFFFLGGGVRRVFRALINSSNKVRGGKKKSMKVGMQGEKKHPNYVV